MNASDAEPALAGLLRRTLCPTPLQTLFLRACLRGDLDAWKQWSDVVGDPKHELGNDSIGIKRLVPLLYTALRDSGAELDSEFLSYLRAAYVREDLRSRTFRRVCGEALNALGEANISFIVLPGVSLAESAYPTWALRHCHDVDLWIESDFLASPIAALNEFRIFTRDKNNVTMVHPTNLPVALHTRLFEHYENPPGIHRDAEQTSITGVQARVLSPHHCLLHICVHAASGPSHRMLLWVADAMHLLRQNPGLNWKALLESASQTALPAYVMLRYLRENMEADIPLSVLEELGKRAHHHKGAALKGVAATIGKRGVMRSAENGSERIWVWRWGASQILNLLRHRRNETPK